MIPQLSPLSTNSLNSAVVCTALQLAMVSPEQRAMALLLQSEGLGFPCHTHMSSSYHTQFPRQPQIPVHLLCLFALVSMTLTLSAPHTWALPFNHYCLGICYFWSTWPLSPVPHPCSRQAGSPSPHEHSHLPYPPIWDSAFLNQTQSFHFSLALNEGPGGAGYFWDHWKSHLRSNKVH